ncbi:hypothetical protein ACQPZX_01980 [Actinoplanes sp. CA-142083]|uniref:hypothetical protein n=1 Tax=Actinoplanes sp. CA-142083 TaxID=3239903 RepID=UPI003D8CD9BB
MAHIVVLLVAVLTLLFLPCVVAAVFCADEAGPRRWWTRQGRRELRALRRLDRALRASDPIPSLALLDTPSIEQLAFDLRRLAQQRRGGPSQQSEKWRAAVLRAYDERLCLACRALGLTEHLGPLQGMDRELERLRVESELQAAGLALR